MFFSLTNKDTKPTKTKDLYEQLSYIVTAILHQELPELNSRHHILYTANVQLEQYRLHAQYHRSRTHIQNTIGTFHQQTYQENLKYFNQLQLLIDAYMQLSIIDERDSFNHRLKMKDTQVQFIYEEIQNKSQFILSPQQEKQFWHALKEDISPILDYITP